MQNIAPLRAREDQALRVTTERHVPWSDVTTRPMLAKVTQKMTHRYHKGDLDINSIVAYLTHLRDSGELPKEILRVRGRLRNTFPGIRVTKKMISDAYAREGWDIDELDRQTNRQVRKFQPSFLQRSY